MALDYRDLLIKYMHHVALEEGVTFLHTRPDFFSNEEWTALQELDQQPLPENAAGLKDGWSCP